MEEQKIQQGAVQSYEDCPQCKSTRSFLMETHVTGEQVGSCERCGYSYTRKALFDKSTGKPILDMNNQLQYVVEEVKDPYGVVHIVGADEVGNTYGIATEEQYLKMIVPYVQQHRDLIAQATLTQYRDGKFIQTNLLEPKTE